jgi:hypothetical protein
MTETRNDLDAALADDQTARAVEQDRPQESAILMPGHWGIVTRILAGTSDTFQSSAGP